MALTVVAGALLPLAAYMHLELFSSVGRGEGTGKVFVSKQSEAARRGYAVSGEGRTAYRFGAQATRSEKIFAAAAVNVGLAVVLLMGLMLTAATGKVKSLSKSSALSDFGKALLIVLGAVLVGALPGAIIGFFIFAPLKTLSDPAFNVWFTLIWLGATVFGAWYAGSRDAP